MERLLVPANLTAKCPYCGAVLTVILARTLIPGAVAVSMWVKSLGLMNRFT